MIFKLAYMKGDTDLFMKGLRGAFPGFFGGRRRQRGRLREGGRSLEGSFFDKNASRDGFRADC